MDASEAARQDKMGDQIRKQLEKDRRNLQIGGSREEKLDVGEGAY